MIDCVLKKTGVMLFVGIIYVSAIIFAAIDCDYIKIALYFIINILLLFLEECLSKTKDISVWYIVCFVALLLSILLFFLLSAYPSYRRFFNVVSDWFEIALFTTLSYIIYALFKPVDEMTKKCKKTPSKNKKVLCPVLLLILSFILAIYVHCNDFTTWLCWFQDDSLSWDTCPLTPYSISCHDIITLLSGACLSVVFSLVDYNDSL